MRWLHEHRTEQIWWGTVIGLLLLACLTCGAMLVDKRVIDGASVWAKPLKFELSLALHFATLAIVAAALNESARTGVLLWGIAVASMTCTVFEIGYIIARASRAEASHFNVGAPFDAAMYALMAAGAVVITAAAAAVGAFALFDGAPRLGPAARLGAGVGLIGGALLTLVIAFRMGGALSHHVGVEPPGAARVPLTGWSLAVGDRRVPHFFATHMMQAVPLAGFAGDLLLSRPTAIILVVLVGLIWTVLTLGLFQQANAGLPLHRWP